MADEYCIDNSLLISLVEQKSILWDNSLDLYKNRVATQAAWKEIMMVLNPDFKTRDEKLRQAYVKQIVQRWTHIRDSYNRSYKKIQEQKTSGDGAKKAKPYVYSRQLKFLQNILQSNPAANDNTTENDKTYFKTNDGSETSSIVTNNTVTRNRTLKRIPKRPMKNYVNHVYAKMVKLMDSYSNNEPKVTNRHLSFFNGILPTLDDFDDNEVLEFQMGVLQLLKDIKSSRHYGELPSVKVNEGSPSGHTR